MSLRFTQLCGLSLLCSLGLSACFGTDSISKNEYTPTNVAVEFSADYGKTLSKLLVAESPILLQDSPSNTEGTDLDGDGGVVRFTTPSSFQVAVKAAAFLSNEDTIWISPRANTLIESPVLDLSSPLELDSIIIPEAGITGSLFEIYYYELTLELNEPGQMQTVRIYMSDDDFEAQGNLGHHQGDIVIIDDQGEEAGWAPGCELWTVANAIEIRDDEAHMGAGGVDSETGHSRGFFGDGLLWNSKANQQGESQDILHLQSSEGISASNIDKNSKIAITFDLRNSWYFEDFDDNLVFNAGGKDSNDQVLEACHENSSWAPLLPWPSYHLL